jgi:hypothetical protein
MDSGDTSDNMWNLEDIWSLQQQLNNLWKGKIKCREIQDHGG